MRATVPWLADRRRGEVNEKVGGLAKLMRRFCARRWRITPSVRRAIARDKAAATIDLPGRLAVFGEYDRGHALILPHRDQTMSQALSNPVVLILGSLFVVGVIAIVLSFFISMFGNTTYKTRLADIKKIRDDAQRENASLDDISEDQRLRREVKIDQRFARSLDALEQNKVVLDKTARWALAASGTAGLIVFFLYYFDVLKRMWESSSLLMIATAYAQSGASKNEIRGGVAGYCHDFVCRDGGILLDCVGDSHGRQGHEGKPGTHQRRR
jgi:hypothetical protein